MRQFPARLAKPAEGDRLTAPVINPQN